MTVLDKTKRKMTRDQKASYILRVQLGASMTDIATEAKVAVSTVQRWCNEYKRPPKDIVINLLYELVASRLTSSPQGAELNALVNACKLMFDNEVDSSDMMAMMMQLGDSGDDVKMLDLDEDVE